MPRRLLRYFRMDNLPARLKSVFTQNLLSKVVALVVALLLYMFTTGEKNVVTSMKLQLEVVTPEELVLANTLPSEVFFQIKGPRARINSVLNRHEILSVNLSGSRPGISSVKIHPDMLTLPPGVEVTGISPSVIEPKLEPLVEKEVAVKLVMEGEVAEGYRLVKHEVRPPNIKIKGSSTKLAQITEVSTVPFELAGLKETIEKEVDISLAGTDLFYDDESEEVKAYVEIEAILRGKTFKGIPVSVLTRYKANVIPKVVRVKIRGPEVIVKDITADEIKAEVDLQEKDPGWYRQAVTIKLPPEVKVLQVYPKTVRVNLK